jgi:hypothetical protein
MNQAQRTSSPAHRLGGADDLISAKSVATARRKDGEKTFISPSALLIPTACASQVIGQSEMGEKKQPI